MTHQITYGQNFLSSRETHREMDRILKDRIFFRAGKLIGKNAFKKEGSWQEASKVVTMIRSGIIIEIIIHWQQERFIIK